MAFLQGFEKLVLSKEQRLERLSQNKWSQELGMDATELAQLAEFLTPYQGPEGAQVFRQGDPGSFMCLVNSGQVNIYKTDSKKPDDLIASIGPENTVGEMALIDGDPRSAFAFASCRTVLFIMTRSNFMRLGEEYPAVWGKLLFRIAKLMSSRLRKANELAAAAESMRPAQYQARVRGLRPSLLLP
jgi:CRP-like cAMP-binding protein